MATLQELLQQRETLDRQIKQTQSAERENAVAKIRALMAEFGVTVADLTARPVKRGPVEGRAKVAAKYRNQVTGESWTGRGLKPKWLSAALAEGKQLSDFAV